MLFTCIISFYWSYDAWRYTVLHLYKWAGKYRLQLAFRSIYLVDLTLDTCACYYKEHTGGFPSTGNKRSNEQKNEKGLRGLLDANQKIRALESNGAMHRFSLNISIVYTTAMPGLAQAYGFWLPTKGKRNSPYKTIIMAVLRVSSRILILQYNHIVSQGREAFKCHHSETNIARMLNYCRKIKPNIITTIIG